MLMGNRLVGVQISTYHIICVIKQNELYNKVAFERMIFFLVVLLY